MCQMIALSYPFIKTPCVNQFHIVQMNKESLNICCLHQINLNRFLCSLHFQFQLHSGWITQHTVHAESPSCSGTPTFSHPIQPAYEPAYNPNTNVYSNIHIYIVVVFDINLCTLHHNLRQGLGRHSCLCMRHTQESLVESTNVAVKQSDPTQIKLFSLTRVEWCHSRSAPSPASCRGLCHLVHRCAFRSFPALEFSQIVGKYPQGNIRRS